MLDAIKAATGWDAKSDCITPGPCLQQRGTPLLHVQKDEVVRPYLYLTKDLSKRGFRKALHRVVVHVTAPVKIASYILTGAPLKAAKDPTFALLSADLPSWATLWGPQTHTSSYSSQRLRPKTDSPMSYARQDHESRSAKGGDGPNISPNFCHYCYCDAPNLNSYLCMHRLLLIYAKERGKKGISDDFVVFSPLSFLKREEPPNSMRQLCNRRFAKPSLFFPPIFQRTTICEANSGEVYTHSLRGPYTLTPRTWVSRPLWWFSTITTCNTQAKTLPLAPPMSSWSGMTTHPRGASNSWRATSCTSFACVPDRTKIFRGV